MENVKFKITYGQGASYSYNNIKASANDKSVYDTALAFAQLREGDHESIYKVIETDITA